MRGVRCGRSFLPALICIVCAIALGEIYPSLAQAPSTPTVMVTMPCGKNPANPEALNGDAAAKNALLTFGLPCQETVSPNGPNPNKTSLENLQNGFDFYSWLTFIALNSPQNGSIELANSASPTKWEDSKNFIQLLDVMRPDVKDPSKEPKIIPPGCLRQYKDGTMVIKMIEETFNEPFKTGPLIDQRQNYALFDILMNKQMFDFIVKHQLFSQEKQQAQPDLKIDFPAGQNADPSELGAVMLKVSWKILEADEDKAKFHTVDALVSMPKHGSSEPPCLRKTLGLVGFHIVHKTMSRLQWIWTSFEHVDNVPEQRDVDARNLKISYNFFDPSCSAEKCPVNEVPPRPWDPVPANELKFRNSFNSQITRVVPLTDDVKDMNKKFQAILAGTVWKNYMLLSTQWPSDFFCAGKKNPPNDPLNPNTDFHKQPDMTCAPAPTYLANSTLETYSQGTVPLASSSCMACHGNATSYQRRTDSNKVFNQSDFTFILEKAVSEERN
jgi:hypothetical protein